MTKPRALTTFLDGLAEVGIDNQLIKNKKLLCDLIKRDKEGDTEEGSSDREGGEDEIASENSSEEESNEEEEGIKDIIEKESDETESSDTESTLTQYKNKNLCCHCENFNQYITSIMRCPKCLWHDDCRICPVCNHQIPLRRKNIKEGLAHCHDCDGIKYRNRKTSKTLLIHLLMKQAVKKRAKF